MKNCFIALVCLLALIACGGPSASAPAASAPAAEAAEAKVTLKLGTIVPVTDILHTAAEKMISLATEKSKGSIEISIFPNSQLGSPLQQIEGVRLGSQEMVADAISWVEDYDGLNNFRMIAIPSAFKSIQHLQNFFASEKGTQLIKTLDEKYNLVVLSYNWARTPRQILSRIPVRTVEDIKKLKIRKPELELWVSSWKLMGATPTPIAWAEIYTSLQQNIINTVASPIQMLYSNKFYEQAKHLTMTNHTYNTCGAMINKAVYAKMTSNQQKALKDAAVEAGVFHTKLFVDSEAEFSQKLKDEGVEFIEISPETRTQIFSPLDQFARDQEKAGKWEQGLWDFTQKLPS